MYSIIAILVTSNGGMLSNPNLYVGDFWESFIWLSMDHSKDNLKNNYLIFKSIYFILKIKITAFISYFFLITISHFFYIIITSILIPTSFLSPMHQHEYDFFFNICLFMSMKCILIFLKFDIDINNDELLKTI
jgi:hypothetical protein